MRNALLVLVMLAACGDDLRPIAPDAPPQAIDASTNTFNVPIGARCDDVPSYLCASGAGACIEHACREQCHEPPAMRCPGGFTPATYYPIGDDGNPFQQCVCEP